ncbi:alpha/beta-hydrolase [Lentinus tigrinus ALCF2SS1-6]|uniref:Alpha/beta-hydrolase n=1 Tax=Lentinus tigrinus ALCF2SS1-6 TaxID=1328759 RepID=A0A5C2SK16_9APHY|nr:alpha/beta-hydrolase [Lentinus tigrinus ALCF2SS1-6]
MIDPLLVLNAMVVALAVGSHLYATRGNHISWGPCDSSITNDTSLACGFFDVPLDYHDVSAGTARLAVIKASGTGHRRGSLFFNPGGPGISGVQRLAQNKDTLLAIGGGVYDVVSWDLRGVGDLTIPGEVRCFNSLEDYNTLFNGTIEINGIDELDNFANPVDVQHLLDQATDMEKKYNETIQKCLSSPSGRFLKYIGAAAAVRDVVSLADALDGPGAPVNYVGVSYGTLMGTWLVNMFPERVGRVILDSILDPIFFATQEPSTRWVLHQFVVSDTVYRGLITGCALAGPDGCAAASEGDSPSDIDTKIQRLLKALYDASKGDGSPPMTSGQLRNSLFALMNTPGQWSTFMNDVYPQLAASVGTGPAQKTTISHPLLKRAAAQAPSYASTGILCGDSTDEHGTTMTDVFNSIIAASRNVSHVFAATWPFVPHQCLHWPVRAVERYQGPFNKTPANPLLISANTYDPITPLTGAELLASLLGQDGVLVHKNGFGHTMFVEPSSCINSIYAAYVVNGTLPANNTVCDIDDDFEVFKGVTTSNIVANLQVTD